MREYYRAGVLIYDISYNIILKLCLSDLRTCNYIYLTNRIICECVHYILKVRCP